MQRIVKGLICHIIFFKNKESTYTNGILREFIIALFHKLTDP